MTLNPTLLFVWSVVITAVLFNLEATSRLKSQEHVFDSICFFINFPKFNLIIFINKHKYDNN